MNKHVIFCGLLIVLLFITICFKFPDEIKNFNADQNIVFLLAVASLVGFIVLILQALPKFSETDAQNAYDKTKKQLNLLLDRVESLSKQKLEQSLHQIVLLALGKQYQPSQVDSSFAKLSEMPGEMRLLPPETTIGQVFGRANKLLLILGEPGSGKSTTLLQLAEELIQQVREGKLDTIPVVLNLSSWAMKQHALEVWMAEEISAMYQIPKIFGAEWLKQYHLLPLLDGLDEVKANVRHECLNAINVYLNTAGNPGLVVCCREQDYKAIPDNLRLNTAISLQSLNSEQITTYIDAAGGKLSALTQLLAQDEELRCLAQTPLMLSVMSMAYLDEPRVNQPDPATAVDRKTLLFDKYINRMFSRRQTEPKLFSDQQVVEVLSWLARQMQKHGQSSFLMENLQPDWLSSRLGFRLMVALFWVLSFFICLDTLIEEDPLYTFLVCLFFGLGAGFFAGGRIELEEQLSWRWETFFRKWKEGFLVGLLPTSITCFILPLIFYLSGQDWIVGLKLNAALSILLLIFITLNSGATNFISEDRRTVNQGVTVAFKNSIYIGTPVGLALGLIFWYLTRVFDLTWNFTVSIALGCFFGFYFLGGESIIDHYLLRLLLILEKLTPIRFVAFLDYASRLILLRRVGGSYEFIHRLLLEHFANKRIK